MINFLYSFRFCDSKTLAIKCLRVQRHRRQLRAHRRKSRALERSRSELQKQVQNERSRGADAEEPLALQQLTHRVHPLDPPVHNVRHRGITPLRRAARLSVLDCPRLRRRQLCTRHARLSRPASGRRAYWTASRRCGRAPPLVPLTG
jgi:hypothetical protein